GNILPGDAPSELSARCEAEPGVNEALRHNSGCIAEDWRRKRNQSPARAVFPTSRRRPAMIYMLALAMMLTTLIATAFALIHEAGSRRQRRLPIDMPLPARSMRTPLSMRGR